MNNKLVTILTMAVVVSCTSNKITGRKQLNIISNAQMIAIAESQYTEVLGNSKVVTNTKTAGKVAAIGKRIVEAVNKYYKDQGMQG